ncbi:AAEL013838-PA [Aedes aegypti]|uniref:AAEL013838-PA n=1 Tax=Aedes aegypti TaxID=7159 RepID=Q16I07_AEDAE|nr:AAEL013838-PA [Aedes aegypti]
MAYVVAPNIEPFRKGQTFATWIRRLTYHFRVNKVQDNDKKDQMFLLGGDYMFSEAEKLYPTKALLDEVSYEVLVQKLRERLDRTDSVLLQRYHFSSKLQQAGESASTFIFSLKLQAEHCEFGDQKNRLISDRLLVGLSDTKLKHRLLTEDSAKLTLEQAEKIIATWEMAATHTKALANNEDVGLVGFLNARYPLTGGRGAVIQRFREAAQGFRGPVKSRLGVRPEIRPAEDRKQERQSNSRVRFRSQQSNRRDASIMVGNEATTTAHPTQIRLVKDGSGSGQPRRSMVVVDNGRSMLTTAEPGGTAVNDDDVRQLPNRSSPRTVVQPGERIVEEPDVRQIPDLSVNEERRKTVEKLRLPG